LAFKESIFKSSIHKLINKFSEIIDISIETEESKSIANKPVVKINGYRCFVGATFGVVNMELIEIDVSAGRSSI
jgi:hypothetical protein